MAVKNKDNDQLSNLDKQYIKLIETILTEEWDSQEDHNAYDNEYFLGDEKG